MNDINNEQNEDWEIERQEWLDALVSVIEERDGAHA